MDKAHNVENVTVSDATMNLRVDGKDYTADLASQSKRLANAKQSERENFEISPAGCGIYWPDVDEDISIDGLIGVKQQFPVIGTNV